MIEELVNKYIEERDSCLKSSYNETQLRNDYINPLLKYLGWDVDNINSKTQYLRDVIQEEYIDIEGEIYKKNPDYTLRVNGTRKIFVEVKKPSVEISKSSKAAFQIRRYGWNANLNISILTNFEYLIIYDCRFKPEEKDNEVVARYRVFQFNEYVNLFDEIQQMISFNSANSGIIDKIFPLSEKQLQTFDSYFLQQIENWRIKLTESAINLNKGFDTESLNFMIQRLINRIIFLRICEDRTIEKYETLKHIKNYDELKSLFQQSDSKYNSGLFDFIDDNLSLDIILDEKILIEIFNELYYPLSPYNFSVVDPTILSQIYERFLGKKLIIEDNHVSILDEPEIAASDGVVPTPKIIVEQIIKDTLLPLIKGKSFTELSSLKIADICCGSGTFLLSAYDFMMEHVLKRIIEEKIEDKELINHDRCVLTLKAKREILEQNLYGVDINPYAVEVTEFSLLLKLLEDENKASIDDFINQYAEKVLPNLTNNIKCGNSLVDSDILKFIPELIENNSLLFNIKPFDWTLEFPFLADCRGFDAIVGNPPYVRIQNMIKYAPIESDYYQLSYFVAKNNTIDKYYLFLERAIKLLNDKGFLGYIVPHKFFLLKGGKALREYITQVGQISKIIHFGILQIFPFRSTYTAILILQKEKKKHFLFKKINSLSPETIGNTSDLINYNSNEYNSSPWIFTSIHTNSIFCKLREKKDIISLGELTEICVGLQTSKDDVYIFTPIEETDKTYIFFKNGEKIEIEKHICLSAIYDLSFGLFDLIKPNSQIIFPYYIHDGKAELYTEKEMYEYYPLTFNYLSKYKPILIKRKLQGKNPKWYQYGRSQSLTKFHNAPKLIWSVLATDSPYTYDENNLQFTGGGNGPYYALINKSDDYHLYYFLGILCHPLFEAMVKSGASEFRGEYYSHGKQFLENIPIRVIDFNKKSEEDMYMKIIKIVERLINSKRLYNIAYGQNRAILKRKYNILFNQLIDYINILYGITPNEYNIVINDEMLNVSLMVKN